MVIRPDFSTIQKQLPEHLPPGYNLEATARTLGAFTRARGVKDVQTLFQLAMAYGGCGMSLRETCAWAAAVGIAEITDPSLIDRLCNAAPWLGDIMAAVIARQAGLPAKRWSGYRLRALDATTICEPGADRTTWRLHVGYDLAGGQVDHVELTDVHGGENLQRLKYQPGDIVLGDRIYARAHKLQRVKQDAADFIVRTGWNSMRLQHKDGRQFDLFAMLRDLTECEGEVKVQVDGSPGTKPLELRLIIWRKTPEQAEEEQKRLLQNGKKHGRTVDPRSLEAAKYVMLVTSLPAHIFSTSDILAIYRFRWQIELAFKRMKSLAGLDELAAKKPELAKAWIYARLIAFLIAEQNAGQVPESSPSGPGKARAERQSKAESIALAPHKNGSGLRSGIHSRAAAMEGHPQRSRENPAVYSRGAAQAKKTVGSAQTMLILAPMRAAPTHTLNAPSLQPGADLCRGTSFRTVRRTCQRRVARCPD